MEVEETPLTDEELCLEAEAMFCALDDDEEAEQRATDTR